MMRKNLFLFLTAFFLLAVAVIVYMYKFNALPAITYFPIDEHKTFIEADSSLEFSRAADEKGYDITWKSSSQSHEPLYLRQDASLLFANGKLLGVRSKWLENSAVVHLEEKIHDRDSRLFQVISYHHGEVHYPDETIKGIQRMSHDSLYTVKSAADVYTSFHSPKNNSEEAGKKELDKKTHQQLLYHWNELMAHFNVDKKAYTIIPLTELYTYDQKQLPGMSEEKTAKTIGQLWEGIYKNYMIPAARTKQKKSPNYEPIVLVDKENSYLLVLFELNGKRQKLMQRL